MYAPFNALGRAASHAATLKTGAAGSSSRLAAPVTLLNPQPVASRVVAPAGEVAVEFVPCSVAAVRVRGGGIAVLRCRKGAPRQGVFQKIKLFVVRLFHASTIASESHPCPTSDVSDPTPNVPGK